MRPSSLPALVLPLLLAIPVAESQWVSAMIVARMADAGIGLENVRAVPSQVEAGKTVSLCCAVLNLSSSNSLTVKTTSRFEIYMGTTLVENLAMLENSLSVAPGGSVDISRSWSTAGRSVGTYRFLAVVEGESAGIPLTASGENSFTIVSVGDFYLNLDPPSGQGAPGSTVSSTVYVRAIGTFTESVSLSLSGIPGGVSASLSQTSGIPPFSSILSLALSSSAMPGTYPITVRGTSATKMRENIFTLTVRAPENLPVTLPPENVPRKATRMLLFLHPLLVEVVPRVPYSIRFGLHNPDNVGIENVFLSQEGIEGATLTPARLGLPAREKGFFTLGFTLPPETPEGLRTVTVSAFAPYENLLASRAFYLRVKQDRRPWVNRAVELDRLENKTIVTLTLQNGDRPLTQALIREFIPPALIEDLSQVQFEVAPSRVYPENRIVEWAIRRVRARERKTFTYWIPRLPPPEFDVTNWFLAGLILPRVEPFGLRAWAENFTPGEGARIWVTVFNYTEDNISVSVTLKLPEGFYIMGEGSKTVGLGPRENVTVNFLCMAHKTVRPGTYKGKAVGTGEERTVEAEFDMLVLSPPPFPWHLLILPFLGAVVAALLIMLLRRERKRARGRRFRIRI